MKLKDTPWKKIHDQPRQHIKNQRHYFVNKRPSSQSCGFSSSQVWMWELDCKESWSPKNWYFWTVVMEKTLVSPLDCQDIQAVYPEGNQSWIFIGRTDAEAETEITSGTWYEELTLWKKPWCWERLKARGKGAAEDEMVGWHHRLNGHEFEQAPGVGGWTGKPGILQSMGSQRVGHQWMTEQQQQQLLIGLPPWVLVLQYLVKEGVVTQIEHPSP